jgi:hypothetical protein
MVAGCEMGEGRKEKMGMVLWCCGVVVLWCCGVVVLLLILALKKIPRWWWWW